MHTLIFWLKIGYGRNFFFSIILGREKTKSVKKPRSKEKLKSREENVVQAQKNQKQNLQRTEEEIRRKEEHPHPAGIIY